MKITRALAVAAVLAAGADSGQAATFEVSFTASGFSGWAGANPTFELPPDDELSGRFVLDTELGVRDVPDFYSTGTDSYGLVHDILNVYMAPMAVEIEIAGHAYALEEVAAYFSSIEGQPVMIQIGGRLLSEPMPGCGTPGFVEQGITCPPVRYVTYGTDDFNLLVQLPLPGYESDQPGFVYTTQGTVGSFGPTSLRVTVRVDGGDPMEFVQLPPEPVDAFLCAGAYPVNVNGELQWVDFSYGAWLCDHPEPPRARARGAASSLRDARVPRTPPAEAGLGAAMLLRTALGVHRLDARRVDRLLLGAAKGGSPAVAPPEASADDAMRCAKVKPTRGAPRFRGKRGVPVADPAGGVAHYDVRRPRRVCAAPNASEGGADRVVCYRARRAAAEAAQAAPRSRVWVAHALGVEHLSVGRVGELCLPAEVAE